MSCKVSVIVPVYNVEKYLEESIQSIIHQTLSDIEIICVNDGSTDNSLAMLRRFEQADSRIRVISQPNRGYGAAMNVGLEAATGEYIGIVEPDDFISLDMYENLYHVAMKNNLDIAKADFYRFTTDERGKDRTYVTLSHYAEDYYKVMGPQDKMRTFRFVMNTWSGIYRNAFLRDHGIRHNETPGASYQDNGFWFQTFAYAQRIMIIDKPGYWCRRDNANSSVNNPGKVYAINKEYDFIREKICKDEDDWQELKGYYWRKRVLNYLWTLQRIDGKYINEYLQVISKELKEGFENREFSEADFSEEEWNIVQSMIAGTYIRPGDAEGMVRLLLNSRSYKLGRALTYLPRKIRKLSGRGE